MRSFLAALAVILGLLLSAVAVPAIWVDRNIVQEDGFVALAAPLGKDPDFPEAAGDRRRRQHRYRRHHPGAGGRTGPAGAGMAAASLTGLPEYPAAWEETLRKSHRLNFADPASLPPEADSAHLPDPGCGPACRPRGQADLQPGWCSAGSPGPDLGEHRPVEPAPARRTGFRILSAGIQPGRRRRSGVPPGARDRPPAVESPGRRSDWAHWCFPDCGRWRPAGPPTP